MQGSEQLMLPSWLQHSSCCLCRIWTFGRILVFGLRNIVKVLARELFLVCLSAFELVGGERVVWHHGAIAVDFKFLVEVAVLWRDAVLNVELLKLRPVVVRLQPKDQVLRSVEVELLLFGVLHGQIVPANLDLVKFTGVDQHLAFGLFQETLNILRLQAVVEVLIFGRHRLLGSKGMNRSCQTQWRV